MTNKQEAPRAQGQPAHLWDLTAALASHTARAPGRQRPAGADTPETTVWRVLEGWETAHPTEGKAKRSQLRPQMHTEQENGCYRDGSGRHQSWLSPHSALLAVGLFSLKSLGAPDFYTDEAETLLYFCHLFICYPPSFIYLILLFFSPFGGCILFFIFSFPSFLF